MVTKAENQTNCMYRVLASFPGAYHEYNQERDLHYVINPKTKTIIGRGFTCVDAWLSAYENYVM